MCFMSGIAKKGRCHDPSVMACSFRLAQQLNSSCNQCKTGITTLSKPDAVAKSNEPTWYTMPWKMWTLASSEAEANKGYFL